MDKTYLKELGPFLQALSCIASRSEEFKYEGDMVEPGKNISYVYGNMAGSFMLFRGTIMLDNWIKPYVKEMGKSVKLPGNNSCSKSLPVALVFAFKKQNDMNKKPTLFVIATRNYNGIAGVSLNTRETTAYPSEGEVLLAEGCEVHIMAVDTDVIIEGTN